MKTENRHSLNSQFIKEAAIKAGFVKCGIAKVEKLTEEETRLSKWLEKGLNGKMKYMNNHFEKRLNPALLLNGAKSVISLLYNYNTTQSLNNNSLYKISKYAYGSDYHYVIKDKLAKLVNTLTEYLGKFEYRYFVDSAPVMEKAWAQKAGLGWIGKNTNLVTKEFGSFNFIAEIILDIELEYDSPVKDSCGKCTRCVEACPTNAIYEPYKIDATKCISYLTIELKGEIPEMFKGKFDNWIFGCDICQDVCPWNNNTLEIHNIEPSFEPNSLLLSKEKDDWENLNEEQFNKLFRKSAVKRTKFAGLKRNIDFLKKK